MACNRNCSLLVVLFIWRTESLLHVRDVILRRPVSFGVLYRDTSALQATVVWQIRLFPLLACSLSMTHWKGRAAAWFS